MAGYTVTQIFTKYYTYTFIFELDLFDIFVFYVYPINFII